MYHVDNSTGVPVMPQPSPVTSETELFFTEGGNGVPPTFPGPDWFNIIQSELINILRAAGLDPDKMDNTQILAALKKLFLSRSNPFGDIKADGAAAIATALSNLGFLGEDVNEGDALMAVKQPFTGAKLRTQHEKNAEFLTTNDFEGISGDGIHDDSEGIQLAINAACQAGIPLHIIGAGKTFKISSRMMVQSNCHIIIHPGVTLRMEGDADAYMFVNGDGSGAGGYDGCTNVRFDIFGTIDLNGSPDRSRGFIIFAHHSGLLVDGHSVGTITNGYESHYMEINSSENVLIKNIIFPNHPWNGVSGNYETIQIDFSNAAGFPAFGPWDNTPCRNIVIQGCVFESGMCAVGSHSTPPEDLHTNIVISENHIRNHTFGIRPQGWSNWWVKNNTITDSLRRAILPYSSSDGWIVENAISGGCPEYAIHSSWLLSGEVQLEPYRISVVSNIIRDIGGIGIQISNGGDCIISSNNLYNIGAEAISTNPSALRIIIRGNKCRGMSQAEAARYSAIYSRGANVVIEENDIAHGANGIRYTYAIYLNSQSSFNKTNRNYVEVGASANMGIGNAGTLNEINGRTLIFNGIESGGTIALDDDISNYDSLLVMAGAVSHETLSFSQMLPYHERTWYTDSDSDAGTDSLCMAVAGGDDLTMKIKSGNTLDITSQSAYLRKIYGVNRLR